MGLIAGIDIGNASTEVALAELDGGLIEAALSMGSSPLEIIFRVYLKESIAAIARGSLRFARSAEYVLATDPIPFLQGIGYLLIVAAALAYPGWVYWRKWFARRSGSDAPLTPTS